MKRIFVLVLIILVSLSVLAGCNSSKAGINPIPSEVIPQNGQTANETSSIQTTAKPVNQTSAASEKSKPIPVAYVCIDINPSIELGVDSIDNVVSVEAYNEDGKKILGVCNVIGMNLKDAVKLLIAESSKQGFIASDGSSTISITTETLDVNKAENLKNLSEVGTLEALDDCGDCASIYKDNIEFSIREEAKKWGISTGKLMLINKLIILDSSITIDQYKDAKVSEIIAQIKLLSGDKYKSIMNDDVDCADGCMDDCSCVDCSDCKDDHCDADCADGCLEDCTCKDCEDCGGIKSEDESSDVKCADSCKDDCSCMDCDDCDDGKANNADDVEDAVGDVKCSDGCKDDCSCLDCDDCDDGVIPSNCIDDCNDVCSSSESNSRGKDSNFNDDIVESDVEKDKQEEAADIAKDAAEEKADQEMDLKENND